MKKTITILGIIIFIILVIVGCSLAYNFFTKSNEPEQSQTNNNQEVDNTALFNVNEYPRVDASLATQPLTDAFYANFTGTPIDEVQLEYTNTHPSYGRLVDNIVDLIVVTSPSEEELNYANENNVELEVIPVVNEAFVFLVNKQNKVEGLTLKQVQDIYSGEITNWSEVGGDEAEIIPYQRPTNSGSQTGMLELVMKDIEMIEPQKETYEESMAGLIEAIAEYDNSKDALGYSYYYYATTMYSKDTIKLLAIDGVYPNYETIKNNTYPLKTAYYIVIRKSEPEDSNVRKLVDAMLSERGQEVAKQAGYVPVN